jgi:hypothetical protein
VSVKRTLLVTFATEDFASQREVLLESALRSGQFEDVIAWDESRLRSDPSLPGAPLLNHERGVGYWSWKPHIILDALESVDEGDVVVYTDVGRYRGGYTVSRDISPLVSFCERHDGIFPGVVVPNFGPNSRWTRRDCFVLMDCDEPYFWDHPQVQATFSIWLKTEHSLRFLSEWRTYCADVRIVGDGPNTCGLPNLPGFVDHRHDQSIVTNLALRRGVTPFVIDSALFRWLVAARPHSLSASLVVKKIDNVAAIAAGTHPVKLMALESLGSAKLGRFRRDATRPAVGAE